MKRFDILTIFPEIVQPYLDASILKRAQQKRLVNMQAHDLRKWATDKHRTVDDAPYGGGPGMVMKVEPVYEAVNMLAPGPKTAKRKRTRVLLTSAAGRPFDQRRAKYYANRYDQLIIICGRYEGVDHRVAQHIADEEVSVGPYVLTGGELPALTVVDAVTRLIPGVIQEASLEEETFSFGGPAKAEEEHVGEYPQYTRPEMFSPRRGVEWRVPKVLLEGNHAKIAEWREKHRR